MSDAVHERARDWPLFDLRLSCGGVTLRPAREEDLPHLAAIQPLDYEHDPRPEALPGLSLDQHRRRLLYQGYWRSWGTWSPSSWCVNFVVELDGVIVGLQSLEAEDFLAVRTIDSGSWLVQSARGQGVGIEMRKAVLGLAFDHLDAKAAVSSARRDNGASLGVSRHLGYHDNGVSLNASDHGLVELQHLRLTGEDWKASGRGRQVRVAGFDPCRPWFGMTPVLTSEH
jgi:RimJ/RimL family protein N-acetyltransferase